MSMSTCKKCGMGFCPNRVRKVFGHIPSFYCSPQCFTESAAASDVREVLGVDSGASIKERRQAVEKFAAKVLAGQIIDALFEEGAIGEHIAENPDRFAEIVKVIEPLLKEKDMNS